MRVPLEPGDRTLLMVGALLLAATTLVAVLLTPPGNESQSPGYPSSYSTASDGAKAAYLLLDELGYHVERWISLPQELPNPAKGTVLILADPFLAASSDERWQIEQFIRRGGRVLITGGGAALLLPAADIKSTAKLDFEWREFRAQAPGPISRRAIAVSMKTQTRWGGRYPNYVPYFGDEDGAVVVASRIGEGEIIWWAGSAPLTNYGLTRAANLKLYLNSLELGEGTRVLWDEYYHGVRAGFWDYLGRTPVPWALGQIAIVFLAAIFTFGRRSGPIAFRQEESRLSPLEFVETVGDLYERRKAAAGALEVAYNRFRFLLERQFGVSSSADPATVQQTLNGSMGKAEPALVQTIERCQQALTSGQIEDRQAMALVQSLHDYTRRLRLGRIGG